MVERVFDFIAMALLVFFGTFTVLGVLGFLPADIQLSLNAHPLFTIASLAAAQADASEASGAADISHLAAGQDQTGQAYQAGQFAPISYTPAGEKEYPVRISIPGVGIDASVSNPKSTNSAVLDADLSSGAVRYPTSSTTSGSSDSDGALNDSSNVFIFGHSSYLKLVHNQAYRTFDGLQNLQKGDEIEVDGPQNAYVYSVATVAELKDSDAVINVGGNDHLLILSTCDVFGEKEDRFMVTAAFERSYPLGTSF